MATNAAASPKNNLLILLYVLFLEIKIGLDDVVHGLGVEGSGFVFLGLSDHGISYLLQVDVQFVSSRFQPLS